VSSAPPKLPLVGPGTLFTPVSSLLPTTSYVPRGNNHPRDNPKGRLEVDRFYFVSTPKPIPLVKPKPQMDSI
jgi:hypothetical protein